MSYSDQQQTLQCPEHHVSGVIPRLMAKKLCSNVHQSVRQYAVQLKSLG